MQYLFTEIKTDNGEWEPFERFTEEEEAKKAIIYTYPIEVVARLRRAVVTTEITTP